MGLAKLQLERYRLAYLLVDFNDDWLQVGEAREYVEQAQVSFDFDTVEFSDGLPGVMLSFTCLPAREAEEPQRFNRIEARVWGVFRLGEDVSDEEERARLLLLNGTAILHGVLRGTLITATGACVGGPYLLPAMNYVELVEEKRKRAQAGDDPQGACGEGKAAATDE